MDGWMDGCAWMGVCRPSAFEWRARNTDELIYVPAMRLVVRTRSRSASAWERTKDDVASRSARAFYFCDGADD